MGKNIDTNKNEAFLHRANLQPDIHMELIPLEERKTAVCAKCGTTLSVKYKLSHSSSERYCNTCILKII